MKVVSQQNLSAGFVMSNMGPLGSKTIALTCLAIERKIIEMPAMMYLHHVLLLSWMRKPRCGVSDPLSDVSSSGSRPRKRRYALTGQKWQRTHITYRWE